MFYLQYADDYINDDNQDYEAQLLSKEWRTMRKRILRRDKKVCLKCSNEGIEIEGEPYHFLEEGTNSADNAQFFVIHAQTKVAMQFNVYYLAFNKIKHDRENGVYFLKEIIKRGEQDFMINAIAHKSNPNKLLWVDDRYFEIHHTYYQKGRKAWEYPETALQTLCWSCHGSFHEESYVPVLDQYGNNVGNYTPCNRSCGTGWLPQYSHVENGICFQCRGARYKELTT